MLIARALHAVHTDGPWIRLITSGPEIRLLLLTPEVLRIRASFDGNFEEASYSLVTTAWEDRLDPVLGKERTRVDPLPFTIAAEEDDHVLLSGGRLTVRVDRNPFAITVTDQDGQVLHRDVPGIAWQQDANKRVLHYAVAGEHDAFYGFGESTGSLDKSRRTLTLSPKDALGYDPENSDPLYKHIPAGVRLDRATRRASGVFWHTTWALDLDFAREHSNYWPRRTRMRADGGDLDLFVIAGPSIRDVVRRITMLTGRSAMLPRQALGYLASSMFYAELDRDCDQALVNFIDTARSEGIPVDGFQLSSGYTTQDTADGPKRCVFTWNDTRFPDPEGFFASMRERGIVVSPNVKPGILDVHPRLREFADAGVLVRTAEGIQGDAGGADGPAEADGSACDDSTLGVNSALPAPADADVAPGAERGMWWGGPGRFVDFTSPAAREAWATWLQEAVLDKGTLSVWNDNCEYDSIVDQDARVDFEGQGATIGRLRTVMANLMCATTHDAIRAVDPDARPFVVCRAGHAGIQRYAQTWAGDNSTSWRSLQHNIATILGMGLSGVAHHGCDIGGFAGPRPGPELLLRWVQHGIFQPRFSIHSVNSDNTVTEPWMHPSVAPLVREAILLRYRLTPYLYSLMRRAHVEGLPLMEPLVSAFQQDPALDSTSSEFMLGDALLVATVLEEGARTRTVRLPAGRRFHELATGRVHEGGQEITVNVDLSSIPLFLPDGAILPIAAEQPMSLTGAGPESLRILCAPPAATDGPAEFVLYEDDGATRAYERGDLRESTITVTGGDRIEITVTRSGSFRSLLSHLQWDVICPSSAPYWVEIDGERIDQELHRPRFDTAQRAWHYDPELGRALVRMPDDGADHRIVVSVEPFDMIGM